MPRPSAPLLKFVSAVAVAHKGTPEGETIAIDRKLAVTVAKWLGAAIQRARIPPKPAVDPTPRQGKKRGPKIRHTDRAHQLQRERMALHREIRREVGIKEERPSQ